MRKLNIEELLSNIQKNNPGEWEKFQDWLEKAGKAREKVINILANSKNQKLDEVKFNLNQEIWSELKKWMLKNVTFNKCAYCEKMLSSDEKESIYYDAEHFRPKGKVTSLKSSIDVETVDEFGNKIKHPGYFWIAYDYKNLLPSCKVCNSGNGKQNQFPVKSQYIIVKYCEPNKAKALTGNCIESPRRKGYYFLSVEELNNAEEPCIVNPYFDDPDDFLKFDEDGHILSTGNIKGENTIQVLNLDREDLIEGRNNAQMILSDYIDDYFKAIKFNENKKNMQKIVLDKIKEKALKGEGEHSSYMIFNLQLNFTNIYNKILNQQ